MYKNIITLDDFGVVAGVKMVGDDCMESEDCVLLSEYVTDVLETEYDDKTGEFKDKDGNVKYKDPKKPKIKAAKKAKIAAKKLKVKG